MRKEAYTLANEIGAKWEFNTSYQKERLETEKTEKYKKAVTDKIRMENKKGHREASRRMMAAAACIAALIFGTAVFGEKVYAAIEQISWNIGSALGLSGDLAAYSNVVHTSVTDSGYVITLQEVVVAEEKLVVNYTLQREDGEPMEKIFVPVGKLSINGKTSLGGSSGGGQFLNEEHTITGIEMSYDILDDVDLTQENSYQLKFEEIDIDSVKGKWNFQFTADGADLIADTLRVSLQKEFIIEDGVSIVLEELTLNELEQRIFYHIEGSSEYMAMVQVEDGAGHQIEFNTSRFDGRSGNGYMLNEEVIEDGRIAEDAESVTFTLYVKNIPQESVQMTHDYVQVGEAFTIDIY